ncbi:hypothetical protein [Streptomyces canus]|uniref:hypothetical protein n=1 Tax=Streptomyces canus TaxID=58343 RepID=UPI0022555F3D|nr:hypothetical protein [Streptomyces canus]MCX4858345.1 hypothetical protein [Streptomyces canus]
MVNYDLDQLKVGENRVIVGRKDGYDLHGRDIAPGDGWCQAIYAPECAWPRGADLCVRVEWHPDREVGSDWAERLKAVTCALRSLDYVVERAGRPVAPEKDLRADLLVYRMGLGKTPPPRPDDAWAHVPPPRTYHRRREADPLDLLRHWLRETTAARKASSLVVWDPPSVLWPPEADFCAHLRWAPAPGTSSAEIYEGLREIGSVVQDAGYLTRLQERPIPDAAKSVDLLVYRKSDSVTRA